MPFLTFSKSKSYTPIAICRGGKQDDDVLFLSDETKNSNDSFHEIEYSEFEELMTKSQKSQFNKKQKFDLFTNMNMYLKKKAEYITDDNALEDLFHKLKALSNSSKSVKLNSGSKFEVLPTIDPKKKNLYIYLVS